jgi:glutathione S-transferase
LDLPFTHVPVIQAYRLPQASAPDAPLNTTSPEFLKVNPQGQIPAYVEGDLVLTESLSITNHIARTRGGALGPQTPAEAALIDQWTLLAVTAVESPALEILNVTGAGGDKTPEGQATIAICAEKLRRPLKRLEAHLPSTTTLSATASPWPTSTLPNACAMPSRTPPSSASSRR